MLNNNNDSWHCAVLVLLWKNDIILIKRSEKLYNHRGHIAFIGGHREHDEVDPWRVAQREFLEETSLNFTNADQQLEFIRFLRPIDTSSHITIVPVLARLHFEEKELKNSLYSNGEWTHILSVSFIELQKRKFWQSGIYHGSKGVREILFRPLFPHDYTVLKTVGVRQDKSQKIEFLLWGATARIIWDLMRSDF